MYWGYNMNDELEKLKLKIEGHLTLYPEHAPDLVISLAKGLENFKFAIEKQRSSEGQLALKCMMALVMDKKIKDREKAVLLAHTVPFHFPIGFSDSYALVEIKFLMMFCDLYFSVHNLHESDWENNCTAGLLYFANLKSQWEERKLKLSHKEN
jgi:hypothetical protein